MKNLFTKVSAIKRLLIIFAAILVGSATANAATFIVTNTSDSGTGSLREAIANANAAIGADTIIFDTTGVFAAPQTIHLVGALPDIADDLVINGTGANRLTVRGSLNGPRIFNVTTSGSVIFSGLTIAGGFLNLGEPGAGLRNASGTVTVIACTFEHNSTNSFGGAIYNHGTLNVTDSAIGSPEFNGGNTAGYGAGIYNEGILSVSNSTFSRNHDFGGGSAIYNKGTAVVTNSTIAGNFDETEAGGAILNQIGATFSLKSTIVVNNVTLLGESELIGSFSSLDYNVIGTVDSVNASIPELLHDQYRISVEQAKLGPLQNNGGPTPTIALSCGSVAVDKGIAAGLTADQRGLPRTFDDTAILNNNDGTDVGAFEIQSPCSHIVLSQPLDTQFSDVASLLVVASHGDTPLVGDVDFYVADSYVATVPTNLNGFTFIDTQITLPAGPYTVKAVFHSQDTTYLDSDDTQTLNVTREGTTISAQAGNVTQVPVSSPGGTASGVTPLICFDVNEANDGSLGDTSLIDTATVLVSGPGAATITPGSVSFLNGGPGLVRTACFTLTMSNTPIGVYNVSIGLGGDFYMGTGATSIRVRDLSSDLLVGVSVNNNNPKQGDLLTYTITVRNFGPDAATNIVVNDVLSSGTTFQSARANKGTFTAPPSGQSGTVTWYLGNLVTGGQESAQIEVTVVVKGKTTVTNTVTVGSNSPDPNPVNNAASLTTSIAQGGNGGKK